MIGNILVAIVVYFLGCLVYCYLNKDRVGTKEFSLDHCDYYQVECYDVACESCFWPIILLCIIVFTPVKIITKLLELYVDRRKNKEGCSRMGD